MEPSVQPIMEAQCKQLMQAAAEAARKSHSPYSRFPVGAAILTDEGVTVCGTNVENASYGLTVCAERVAIANAVSQGYRRFLAIAVWAEKTPGHAVMPCGGCRQVMAEFFSSDTVVLIGNNDAPPSSETPLRRLPWQSLLPESFSLSSE